MERSGRRRAHLQNSQHGSVAINGRPYGYGDVAAYVQPGAAGTLSNVARLHIVTASADRIVTVYLPTSAATGATIGFTSSAFGGQYLLRTASRTIAVPAASGILLTLGNAAASAANASALAY